jgi:glc operon protein GlcG
MSLILLACGITTGAAAQTIDAPSLSLEGARKVIAAARAEASAQQDDGLAAASAAAIAGPVGTSGTAPPPVDLVTYLPGEQVQAAFAEGKPLLETSGYKVHASRRDRDGQAEVHARDTDILSVLEGTATLVTGGQVVNGRTTAEDELRGDRIAGGDVRRLAKGDVVIVPNGVPHLFKEVSAPFLYYVVKVTAPRRPS